MTKLPALSSQIKSMLVLICFILTITACKTVEATLPTATTVPDTPTAIPTSTEQATPVEPPQTEWVELATMPEPVTEITGALLDGKFYVAGGIDQSPGTTDYTQVYDVATNTWETVASLPKIRDHAAMTSFEGKVYLFSGFDLHGGENIDMAWVYDPAMDAWEAIAKMPAPRYASSAVVVGDYIYIVGGLMVDYGLAGPGTNNEVLRYHPRTNTWDILAPAIEVREHASAVAFDGKIYMIGGRNETLLSSIEIYDPESNTWSLGAPMNEPRSAHVAIVLNDKIYVCGGEDPGLVDLNGHTIDSVVIYNPETNTWSDGPSMPTGTHGLSGFAFEDAIYLVGGSDKAAGAENHGRVLMLRP